MITLKLLGIFFTDQTIYLNLTVRKTPFTEQFDEPMKDIRVKKLYLKRWKPAHLI